MSTAIAWPLDFWYLKQLKCGSHIMLMLKALGCASRGSSRVKCRGTAPPCTISVRDAGPLCLSLRIASSFEWVSVGRVAYIHTGICPFWTSEPTKAVITHRIDSTYSTYIRLFTQDRQFNIQMLITHFRRYNCQSRY